MDSGYGGTHNWHFVYSEKWGFVNNFQLVKFVEKLFFRARNFWNMLIF